MPEQMSLGILHPQIAEVRAGHWEHNEFEEPPGGSLIERTPRAA